MDKGTKKKEMKNMKKVMRTLLAIVFSILTSFQVISAQEVLPILTIEVSGDGQVQVDDGQDQTTLEKGDVYTQSYKEKRNIQLFAQSNEGSKLTEVSLNGQRPTDFKEGQSWQGTYTTTNESATLKITFSKEEQVTGGIEKAQMTTKARSAGIKVNSANKVLWYNPSMPGVGIEAATYALSNGKTAYCGEGMMAGVMIGQSVGDPVELNNANLRKALFYGYQGPNDLLSGTYGDAGALALTSELVSYANCGTSSASAIPAHFNWILSNVGNYIFSQADPVDVYKVYRCSNSLSGTNWQGIYTKRQDICYGEYNPYGKVKIKKASANPSISNDNVKYASMKGSQYGLYQDASCQTLVGTLTLDENGQSNTLDKVKAGRYYLKEIQAPKGFALDINVYHIDVVANQTATSSLTDQPQANPIEIVLKKIDKDTQSNQAQGQASLEGAEFTIRYYEKKDGDPKRTWVIQTDAQGIAKLQDGYKISGDDWYTNQEGQVVFPLGFVTIEETKAPQGYHRNKEIFTCEIKADGNQEKITSYQIPKIENKVKTGKFALTKLITDANQSEIVEGEVHARFVAVLESYYNQANQDIHEALKLAQKQGTEKEWSILTTDQDGMAQSGDLAFGTYIVKQVKVGENAEESEPLKETFRFIVDEDQVYGLLEDGRRIDANKDGLVHYSINDIPFTSYVKIVKKDKDTGKTITLNGAAFQIKKIDEDGNAIQNYSKKTIRTDEKGIVSMKVGNRWLSNFVTNADHQLSIADAYQGLDKKGEVILPLALPSGNYQLIETKAPKGYLLSNQGKFKITKSKISGTDEDGQAVLTMEAKNPKPKGSLTFTKEWEQGQKGHGKALFQLSAVEDIIDPSDGSILYKKDEVIGQYELNEQDQVELKDLPMGIGYSSFKWEEIASYENYQVNANAIKVEFEQKENTKEDVHQEIKMKNNRIRIQTKALNVQTNQKEFHSAKEIEIQDIVTYQGLHKNQSYVLYAQLIDKQTGQVVYNADGSRVEGKKEFKADQVDGSVQVPLKLDASNLGGKDYVIYETLYGSGEHEACEIASHKDLEDKNQTITIKKSKISTKAQAKNESHFQQIKQGKVILSDFVRYEGLIEGQKYVLKGSLRDAQSGEVIQDVSSSKEFVAKSSQDEIQMDFEIDTDQIKAGEKVVVFETLYDISNKKEIEVTSHKDLMDANQTISFIDLHTQAKSENGSNEQQVSKEKVKWTDQVFYEGLEIGQEYTLKTSLISKKSQEEIMYSEQSLIPEESDGSLDVILEVDGQRIKEGEDFVFYESLEKDGKEIAKHEDIEDQNQTIHGIDIHTKAQSEKGNQKVLASSKVTFKDIVAYRNLEVGKEYTVKGTLMNKESKEPLQINGENITASLQFIPEQKDGQVTLEYTLDACALEGKEIVVFEDLYKDQIKVASHADLEDQDQTVKFKDFELKINKIDSSNKQNITKEDFVFTLFSNETCTKKVESVHGNQQDGTASFKIKEGTYFLKETQAPKGYRLNNEVIKVEVKDNQLFVKNQKVETDTNYVYTFSIENTKDSNQVKTGVSTDKAFYVLVFTCALFGLFEVRKHHKKN